MPGDDGRDALHDGALHLPVDESVEVAVAVCVDETR